MTILKKKKFDDELKEILYFIALDSKDRAKKFKNELISKVNDLVFMPYKFRQSIYFEDKNIRDLVFRGYVIAYKIDNPKQTITIIGINKYQEEL